MVKKSKLSYEDVEARVIQIFVSLNARRTSTDDATAETMELIEELVPLTHDEDFYN